MWSAACKTWRQRRSTFKYSRSARRPSSMRNRRRWRRRLLAFRTSNSPSWPRLAPSGFLRLRRCPCRRQSKPRTSFVMRCGCWACAGCRSARTWRARTSTIPDLEPVWATAAELDAFILLHPINVAGADRLSSYYLGNLIGNPLDTTIAAACLVFSGVLERHPSLKICLAHGGGFVPYQAGRFVHGWHVRAEPKSKLGKPPTDSLKRFYFDTIVHSKEVLEFLVGNAGADRVLLGSDYPFDMGMPEGVAQVRGLSISAA